MTVYLFVCMLPMASRTAGPIKTKRGIGTDVDPGSVLVKVNVKVIYLCVRYNQSINQSISFISGCMAHRKRNSKTNMTDR